MMPKVKLRHLMVAHKLRDRPSASLRDFSETSPVVGVSQVIGASKVTGVSKLTGVSKVINVSEVLGVSEKVNGNLWRETLSMYIHR